jgi:hypothetical protein
MATRKTSKTGKTSKKLHAAPTRAAAKTVTRNTAGAFAPYAIPGAAVLGSGILAAAGFVLREQLGHVLLSTARSVVSGSAGARRAAAKELGAAAKELELDRLLSHVGLQSRRSPVLGTGLGVIAGIAAGAALAMWLGPMVVRAFDDEKPSVEEKKPASFVSEEPAMERRVIQDGAA